jgi:U3 small nucleolar RNA-associated protein 5
MVASVRGKSRLSDGAAAPPAKRPRHALDAKSNGLKATLLAAGEGRKIAAITTNGFKSAKTHRVNDVEAVVGRADANGDVDMIEAEADEEGSESGGSDDETDDEAEAAANQLKEETGQAEKNAGADEVKVNGWREPEPEEEEDDDNESPEEPTFGEMMHSHLQEPIDVEASLTTALNDSTAVAQAPSRTIAAPSANSLGTVLTQALRTNDRGLLESCFEMNDLDSVRSTIDRLPSSLVANLLHQLAERMHRRPGRAGNLMVWVQWSLVAHGGYLAGQTKLMAQLRGLKRVIAERAQGLQPLLELKGKLDMLAAQMELRRKMQSAARGQDDDEEAVIYVEGQDQGFDDSEDEAYHSRKPRRRIQQDDGGENEEEDDSFMPLTANGLGSDSVAGDDTDDEENFIDDEADETENEETSEDEGDDDIEDEEESEEETTGPSRRSTAARSGFARSR